MFFDYREKGKPKKSIKQPTIDNIVDEALKNESEWKRVKRRIYSPFWRFLHNTVAHPMLAICRPIGEKLHQYTADKMYKPKDGKDPIISDTD